MYTKTDYTKKVKSFLEEKVGEKRMTLDHKKNKLKKIYKKYAENFILKLAIKKEYGGIEISRAEEVQTKILLTEYNFSLNWLISLLHHSYLIIERIKDVNKKEVLVKSIVDNKDTFAFYTANNDTKKPLTLEKNKKGAWVLNGFIPWLTGNKICKYMLVPAVYQNKNYYVRVRYSSKGSSLKIEPVDLTFENTLGISHISFRNYKITDDVNLFLYDDVPSKEGVAHNTAYYFVGLAKKIEFLILQNKKIMTPLTTKTLKDYQAKLNNLESFFCKNPWQKVNEHPKEKSFLLALQFMMLYNTVLHGKSLLIESNFIECWNQFIVYKNLGCDALEDEAFTKMFNSWKPLVQNS